MKKILMLIFLLLALAGCKANSPAAPLDAKPSVPSTEELSPNIPSSPAPAEPESETICFPEFLTNFTFGSVSTRTDESVTYSFTTEQIEWLKSLLNMESWTIATDVPAMDLNADYALYDIPGNSLVVVPWSEDQCLILAKSGSDPSSSYLYFAPLMIYSNYDGYIRGKLLSVYPNAFIEFRYEYARVNRTCAEDGDYYLDHYIYLFDETQAAALSQLLNAAEKTSVGDEPMVGNTLYYQFYDNHGGMVSISSYLNQHCLINYFPEEGGAFRSFAPLSLIDQVADFMDGVSLLGVVDNTAEYYYDLFRQEDGLEWLVGMATEDGSFCADQLIPFASRRAVSYGPNPTLTQEEIVERHFGLPYPEAEIMGRDFHNGVYLVLEEENAGEDGVITAKFKCYLIPEYYWTDDVLPDTQMDHIKEYLLTGNDADFPEPFLVEIVFEDRFDTETQTSYVFYHSLKILPDETAAVYQAVMLDQQKLITEDGQSITLDDYVLSLYHPKYASTVGYTDFMLCDLDNDGISEVILNETVNRNTYIGRTILHYQDGLIYGYHITFRGFHSIKRDGTFTYSSGAFDHGICSITFDKTSYTIDSFTYCCSEQDENGNTITRYYVEHQETTKDAFDAAIEEQGLKSERGWHYFTPESIAAVFGA